jgi:hypothetical protein
VRRIVSLEHAVQLLAQAGLSGTFAFQPGHAIWRRDFKHCQEQLF